MTEPVLQQQANPRSHAMTLLAEHLEAVLRHGEALRGIELPQAIAAFAGPGVGSILRRSRGMETVVGEVHALELSIILRMTQAGETARQARRALGGSAHALLRLVTVATEQIALANTGLTGPSSAFLAARGIARDQAAIGEDYLVAGKVRLGDVMDAAAAALDMIDAMEPGT